jgi:hypothetical protein
LGFLTHPTQVRMVGAQILAVSDSDNGAIRLLDLVSETTTTLLGNGSRSHVLGRVGDGVARGSAIWGMAGSLDAREIFFTEADSDSVRHAIIHAENGTCDVIDIVIPPPGPPNTTTPTPNVTTTPPPLPTTTPPPMCGDYPYPDVLDVGAYLYTTGGAAFLDGATKTYLVTQRVPPSASPTLTSLVLPHQTYTDDRHGPVHSVAYGHVPASAVAFHLKTTEVFMDTCRIKARYTAYPAHASHASSTLVITLGGNTLEILCSGTGAYGTCTSTVAECRSLAGVYGGPEWTASERAGTAHLRRGASHWAEGGAQTILFRQSGAGILDSTTHGAGVYVEAPRGKLIASIDSYILQVYANADRYTLFQWGIAFDYDPAVLNFVSLETPHPDVFTAPFVTVQPTRVSANTEARAEAPPAQRQGTSVHIATVTFTIAGPPGTLAADAVRNFVGLFLVNVYNNQFLTNSPAHVYDYSGLNHAGNVALAVNPTPVPVGLYAAAAGGTAYVVAHPDGTSYTSTSITATVVRSGFASADAAVSAGSIDGGCFVSNATSGVLSGTCASVVPGTQPHPGVAVTVEHLGFSYPVEIRAYAPTSVRLAVDDAETPLRGGEMRRVRTLVRWGGHPSGESVEVDVTGTAYGVSIAADPAKLEVLATPPGFVRATGSAAYYGANATVSAATQQSVNATVRLAEFNPVKEAAYVLFYRSVQWDAGRAHPRLEPYPKLTQELQGHTLLTVLAERRTLARADAMHSTHPQNYAVAVTSEGGTGYAWAASVPLNAQQTPCEDLQVYGNATYPDAAMVIARNMDIPVPAVTSVVLCCDNAARLSPLGDPLKLTGFSKESHTSFPVTVHYADGSSQSKTSDARVFFTVTENTCGAVYNSRGGVVSVATDGVYRLRATFKGVDSNVVSLWCVRTTGLEPSTGVFGGGGTPGLLSRVNCAASVFQSARASANLRTSQQSVVPIGAEHVAFSTTTPAILRGNSGGLNHGFTGVVPGIGTVRGEVGGFVGEVNVTVRTQSATVASLVVSPFPDDTITGVHGAELPIGIRLTLSDGSVLDDILGGGWPDYTPSQLVPDLILLSTNDPTEVGISASSGSIVLLDNSHQPVTLTVRPAQLSCEGQDLSHTVTAVPVSANLQLAAEGDVDLGGTNGLALPMLTGPLGVPFTESPIDVRVRSTQSPLKAFDMALVYDTTHIHVASCTVGSSWTGSFGCTINNVEGYTQIIGANVNSQSLGSALHLARIVLTPIATGVSRVSGVRIKLSTGITSNLACSVDNSGVTSPVPGTGEGGGLCPFIAGDAPVHVGSPTRAIKGVLGHAAHHSVRHSPHGAIEALRLEESWREHATRDASDFSSDASIFERPYSRPVGLVEFRHIPHNTPVPAASPHVEEFPAHVLATPPPAVRLPASTGEEVDEEPGTTPPPPEPFVIHDEWESEDTGGRRGGVDGGEWDSPPAPPPVVAINAGTLHSRIGHTSALLPAFLQHAHHRRSLLAERAMDGARRRRRLLDTTSGPLRRLMQTVDLVNGHTGNAMTSVDIGIEDSYGDANGDGVFDVSDYLFAQEFYNGAELLGCPSRGGIGCQNVTNISVWQVRFFHSYTVGFARISNPRRISNVHTPPAGSPKLPPTMYTIPFIYTTGFARISNPRRISNVHTPPAVSPKLPPTMYTIPFIYTTGFARISNPCRISNVHVTHPFPSMLARAYPAPHGPIQNWSPRSLTRQSPFPV